MEPGTSEDAESFVLRSSAELRPFTSARLKNITHRRSFVNLLEKKLERNESGKGMRITILCGLRGTGKTVSLLQLAELRDSPAQAFYARGDELLANNVDLLKLVEALDKINREKTGVGKKYVLFVDEVTYLPDWTLKTKVLHDTRPDLSLVLTSSSSLALAFPPDIARRSTTLTVSPLSFKEYLLLKHGISVPEDLARKMLAGLSRGQTPLKEFSQAMAAAGTKNLAGLFEDYLHEDMPLALQTSGQDYLEGMKSVVKKIVYEDFPKYGKLDASLLPKAEQMAVFLARIPCDAVRLENLANHFTISKESVSKVLDLMEKSLLIKGVEAHGRRKAVKLPKKWLFQSPSIRYALAKDLGLESDLTGNLREDCVFAALASVFGAGSVQYSHAADFVVPDKKLAFEVGNKATERTLPKLNTFTLVTSSRKEGGNRIPLHLALLAF
ncbi:ATP-binding protein [Candidatus Micrarchaeota archaeon]|nr:ATP-binding protein [Candidatus Micrarchaeota archaeon]